MLDFINLMTDNILPRIIGDALGSKGFEIGPITLQVNRGPIEYRNIIITRSK
jgi:hypothetical protein